MEEDRNRNYLITPELSGNDAIPSFLFKTYEILETNKYFDIISWTKNGEGFIVKKVKEFAENVLPIHFRHSNYTSFVRQLNMYDFHKTRQENHQNAFKNLMFKKGSKHLLKDIQRKDYKKNKQNSKEPGTVEKTINIRQFETKRKQKQTQCSTDVQKNCFYKIAEVSAIIEKKVLHLAQLREIPTEEISVIKLLDMLFDLKKLNKITYEKCEEMRQQPVVQILKKTEVVKSRLFEQKNEDGVRTDAKSIFFSQVKGDNLGTRSTLFESFKHD